MAQEELLVTLGVKDKGTKSQISAINKELKFLDEEFKKTSKSSEGFENSQEGLSKKLSYLEKKYDSNVVKLEVYKKKIQESKEGIEKKKAELEKLNSSSEDNTKAIARAEKQLAKYREELREAERGLSLTEKEMDNLSNATDETKRALASVNVKRLAGDMEKLGSSLENASNKFTKAGDKLKGIGTTLTYGVSAPILVASAGMVDLASDAEENLNKVNATFEKNADKIIEWSETTLDSFGIGKGSALEFGATIGDVLKGIGFGNDKVLELSKTIIEMSGDIASFKNSSPQEVFEALTAAMTGEYEQLKKYGYVINETILNEHARQLGIKKTTKEMTLQEKALLALNKIQQYSKDATGDFAKTSESTANSAKIFKESLKELAETIGQDLLPIITPLIHKATDMVKEFANMDEQQRQNIIRTGMFAVALPPLLTGLGSLSQIVGTVTGLMGKKASATAVATKALAGATVQAGGAGKAITKMATNTVGATGKVGLLTKSLGLLNPATIGVVGGMGLLAGGIAVAKTHAELMNGTILDSTDNMSAFEKAVAKFSGVQRVSNEELEKMGLKYKDFNHNVSSEFQESVEKSAKKVRDFGITLHEISLDKVFSKEEIAIFNETVSSVMDGAKQVINEKEKELTESLKRSFMLSDGQISEQEQQTLNLLQKDFDTRYKGVENAEKEINKIRDNARKENRVLTEEENAKVLELTQQVEEQRLALLANNEAELLATKKNFREQARTWDLEQTSLEMQERAKQREEERNAVIEDFNLQTSTLELLQKEARERGDNETALHYQSQIEALEAQKQAELTKIQEKYIGWHEILTKENPAIAEQINKFNGEILTSEDRAKQTQLDIMRKKYEEMNTITRDGTYLMRDKFSGALELMTVDVDEATGEIIGAYGHSSKQLGGYSENMANQAKNVAKEHGLTARSIKKAFEDMDGATIDGAGNIVNENGKIIVSLNDFKESADGTRQGIISLNGERIQISSNAQGSINEFETLKRKIDEIPLRKTTTHHTKYTHSGQPPQFAKGTSYAPRGLAIVGEEGTELIQKGNKFMLTGSQAHPVMLSGGEKIYTAEQTKRILSTKRFSGGLFSPNSSVSQQLVNNTINNYSNVNNSYKPNSNGSNVDLGLMAETIARAISESLKNISLQGNVTLDNGQLVGAVSNGMAMNIRRKR